jgi:hypothetical protein
MTPLEIEIASMRALLELFEAAIEKSKQSGEISDDAYNRNVAHIRAVADELEGDMQEMGIMSAPPGAVEEHGAAVVREVETKRLDMDALIAEDALARLRVKRPRKGD